MIGCRERLRHGERIDLRLRRVPGCTQTVVGQGVRRASDFVDGLRPLTKVNGLSLIGAGEETRTPTLKAPDPKSGASANSATPARLSILYNGSPSVKESLCKNH